MICRQPSKQPLPLTALFITAVLLTFAPELISALPAVSAAPPPIRLHIALCAPGGDHPLIDKLSYYIEKTPSLHIRLSRHTAGELFSQPPPAPDVFIWPADLVPPDGSPVHSSSPCVYTPAAGEALALAVNSESAQIHASSALIAFLCAAPHHNGRRSFLPETDFACTERHLRLQ